MAAPIYKMLVTVAYLEKVIKGFGIKCKGQDIIIAQIESFIKKYGPYAKTDLAEALLNLYIRPPRKNHESKST